MSKIVCREGRSSFSRGGWPNRLPATPALSELRRGLTSRLGLAAHRGQPHRAHGLRSNNDQDVLPNNGQGVNQYYRATYLVEA